MTCHMFVQTWRYSRSPIVRFLFNSALLNVKSPTAKVKSCFKWTDGNSLPYNWWLSLYDYQYIAFVTVFRLVYKGNIGNHHKISYPCLFHITPACACFIYVSVFPIGWPLKMLSKNITTIRFSCSSVFKIFFFNYIMLSWFHHLVETIKLILSILIT